MTEDAFQWRLTIGEITDLGREALVTWVTEKPLAIMRNSQAVGSVHPLDQNAPPEVLEAVKD